uniref:Uncharacterized protein n=1 Tax=Ciona savignyi TaxID=51511 RepID=H2YFP2_CIOSA
MEKERKRRQRCASSLISKVEAILSSVETGSVSTSQESSPKIPLASSTLCPSDPTSLVEDNKIETSKSLQVQEHHQTSQDSDNQKTEKNDADSSSDEEESFHETAYRRSLQNLLHKSMTFDSSFQNSFVGGKSESKSINGTAPGSSTPTSSTGNTWAENTQATVVVVKNSKMSDGSDENLETPESRDSEDLMNSTASHFVDSVLEAVRSELGGFASMRSLPGQKDTYEPGFIGSDPEKVDKTNTSSTSSPCKATDHINKALDILNTELACNKSGTTSISTSKDLTENSEIFTLSPFKDNDDFVSPSNCDVTMSTVTPETKEMIVSYKNAMESKEKSETEYTDNTTTDDTLEDKSYESTSKSQSTGKVSPNEGPDLQDVEVAHRVRSGSYSLDAPSPFLINSKDIHSIYSVEADDERGSETTESSIFCRDVKRRLEMPSDSEESHTSVPSSCNKRTATKPKDGVKVNEYCQMLEEQHKNELMALQKQHELQLHMLQKELLKSKPHLTMSVEAITNMRLQDMEVGM